jgi:ribonuclease J
MAKNMHRDFELRKGDMVILSSTPIPGNEKSVNEIINLLHKKGVNVIYESLADVHVSGHACKQELKLIHSLVKPKFFIPVHGEYSHLKHHAELAEDLGMPSKNIFILQNGDILEMNSYDANVKGKVPAGRVFVDGLGVGDVGNIVLRDRRILSEDGLMVVIIKMNSRERKIHKHPDIISRGFVYVRESEDLIEGASEIAYKKVKDYLKKDKTDWNTIKKGVIRDLNNYLYSETKRRPMILPIIVEC